MEAPVRKPYQGVWNVIRFNWHFYAGAFVVFMSLILWIILFSSSALWVVSVAAGLIIVPVIISLGVSYYVYDYSDLYAFNWLPDIYIQKHGTIVNINAGFDETSTLLKSRYPDAHFLVFDFYDPQKHTEVSIARARKAYTPFPQTVSVDTHSIPLPMGSVDCIFNIFSLHEIRNISERVNFLKQQHDALAENASCVVVEHLRDVPNFLAYNIGFFHFYSLREWSSTFIAAGFQVHSEMKITPFVSTFVLKKSHGTTP